MLYVTRNKLNSCMIDGLVLKEISAPNENKND